MVALKTLNTEAIAIIKKQTKKRNTVPHMPVFSNFDFHPRSDIAVVFVIGIADILVQCSWRGYKRFAAANEMQQGGAER